MTNWRSAGKNKSLDFCHAWKDHFRLGMQAYGLITRCNTIIWNNARVERFAVTENLSELDILTRLLNLSFYPESLIVTKEHAAKLGLSW